MPGIVFTNWRAPSRDTTSRHIVVMETNVDVLAILGQLLSDEAYEVSLLCHLADWRDVADLAPDLIMINPAMFTSPVSSTPMPAIVALGMVEPIPIIYCTIDPDIAAELGQAGCTTLLEPFDLEDVLTAVSGALSTGR
jgi:DNA-binding NtrC family response regulator